MHFLVFFDYFWVLIGPQTLPLAIHRSRSLLELTTVQTSKRNWVDLPNQLIFLNFEAFLSFLVIFGHYFKLYVACF